MNRPRNGVMRQRTARPRIEALEDRLVLSWAAVPPSSIPLPTATTAVTLNRQGDAAGQGSINSQIDFYRLIAPVNGTYRFSTATPTSPVNTVLGLYSVAGRLIASNNDAAGTTDSDVTLDLVAGRVYLIGITNLAGTPGGPYQWKVDGPTTEDAYEDNDTRATASDLGKLTSRFVAANLVMADAADWYKFTMAGTGAADSSVRIAFSNALGDLDMRVYDAAGKQVSASLGGGDEEKVPLANLPAGTYYVQVYGWQAYNPNYTLEINTGPADDRYEDNDTRATASDLGKLTSRFVAESLVTADDADWYKFSMTGPGTADNYVLILFTNALGDLDLRLYDSTGKQVGASLGGSDEERVSLAGLPAGAYFVKVYGWQSHNPNYTLMIDPGTADDRYEDNDTLQTAADLGTFGPSIYDYDLKLADAADWFRFRLLGPATGPYFIGGSSTNTLILGLYDASGRLLCQGTFGQLYQWTDGHSLGTLGAGTYYLKVAERDGKLVPSYHLSIWGGERTPDDPYEDNDVMSRTTTSYVPSSGDFPEPNYDLILTDVDWFRLSLGHPSMESAPGFVPGGLLYVASQYGAMDAVLYDLEGHFLAKIEGTLFISGEMYGHDYLLKFTPRGRAVRYGFGVNLSFWDDAL